MESVWLCLVMVLTAFALKAQTPSFSLSDIRAFANKLANNARIIAIGYLTADPSQIVLATKAGQQTPIRAQSWERIGQ